MNTKYLFLLLIIIVSGALINSCTDKGFDVQPTPVVLELSQSHLDAHSNLGRVLFYDAHLSVNNAISCASCHKQVLAFSDNTPFSRGFENRTTTRNALPIQNLFPSGFFVQTISSNRALFWDGRENDLNVMVLKPILNHVEMGMDDAGSIVEKVRNLPYYHDLFMQVYGTSDVTIEKISTAIATFLAKITSTNSQFDKDLAGISHLSASAVEGKRLFFEKYNCNSCHQLQRTFGSPYGTDSTNFINIGLDQVYTDIGRAKVSNRAEDIGKFKVPELRNVSMTAPYMHDGRFSTLEQVLDHYSHGIANHTNLDPLLRGSDGNPIRMNISDQEKAALIAFLNSLTDYGMITNPDFSNPFKIQ